MPADTNKRNAKLPEHVAQQLRDLREEDREQFLALVLALRDRRWPLRAIGEAFGVTRAAVQNWVARGKQDTEVVALSTTISAPELPLNTRGSTLKAKKLVPDVPEEDRGTIRDLTEQASVVKRWTPQDSPARQAAFELENLLYHYAVQRGVPLTRLAEYAGVTRRAVAQRVDKQRTRVAA